MEVPALVAVEGEGLLLGLEDRLHSILGSPAYTLGRVIFSFFGKSIFQPTLLRKNEKNFRPTIHTKRLENIIPDISPKYRQL